MMMRDMMKWCCGPDGRPDFDKMTIFVERHDRASKFDAAGWALFFIWVGVDWLADVGLGIGLLGVAAITLGMQAIRKVSGVRVEGFWVLVGLGFAVAGLWQWIGSEMPLAPIILIAIGVVILFWGVWPKSSHRDTK
jgi:hypothetical protein